MFSFINQLILRYKLKTSIVKIRGRSKIRVKNGAKVVKNGKNSHLVLGYGDTTTPSFKWSGFNFNMMKNSTIILNGKAIIGYNSSLTIEENGTFEMGDKSYIGAQAHIRVAKKVFIGKNCAISWKVTIMDSDFHQFTIDANPQKNIDEVIIEDNVWIGNNVIILKGVHIGEGAIVGAGSVVTKDVKAHTAVAGNPAKVIRDNVSPIH